MRKEQLKGDEVPLKLYTTASNEAKETAKADLEVEDPTDEVIVKTLKGEKASEPPTNK